MRLPADGSARGARLPRLALAALLLSGTPCAVAAQAVLGFGDDATTLAAGVIRLSAENDWVRFDQRFVAPSGASILTRSEVRRTPVSLEAGVTSRLTVGGALAQVGTQVIADYFPDSAAAIHADSARTFSASGLGDAELWARFALFGAVADSARTRLDGVHLRATILALARLGVGSVAPPDSQFGIGTGTAQNAVAAGATVDLVAGRRFWASVSGRYTRALADSRAIRVAPPDDPSSANAGAVFARREPGNLMDIQVTPRLVLGDYFTIGAQYRYRHQAQGSFSGIRDTTDAGGNPVHLDASILDGGSAFTQHAVGAGVVFSTVAAWLTGRASFPVEVSLSRFQDVSRSGLAPKQSETVLGLRLWWPVFSHR